MVVLLSHPGHGVSPVTLVRPAATASVSSSLKSKSPRTHSLLGQSKRKTDLETSRLSLYLIRPLRVVLPESLKCKSAANTFRVGNFTASVGEALTRRASSPRNICRGPSCFLWYIIRSPFFLPVPLA